jgi:dTDP-4-dehydrorhamnose 3,5-epimerase
VPSKIPYIISLQKSQDNRGDFLKIYSKESFEALKIDFEVKEIFSTTNFSSGTIRGMHFQNYPAQSTKIIWVESGSIYDVCVNVNAGANFGEVVTFSLSERDGKCIFVPPGWAHGYQTLKPSTTVSYLTDQNYVSKLDDGVRYDSIDVTWPLVVSNVSERDLQLRRLSK